MASPPRLALLAAVFAPLVVAAQDGGTSDAPFPLTVKVGQAVALCATRTIVCPAGAAVCDDPGVAKPEVTGEGLALRGVKPGTTLCAAQSAAGMGMRRVYRVEVVAATP